MTWRGRQCKEVLSANTERQIVVEGLPLPGGALDGSLRATLTREAFDELTSDIVVQGDDEEIERFQKTLDLREKGMVFVKGILEK